ncbi:MAG: glutamate synthase large subunit [Oscillospiraceae bacterium]|nr:glutamate synthase large subunit [Oscillospiraceae bacterium]
MSEGNGLPAKQGLYDPGYEHDACGIGMLVNIKGEKSHGVVSNAVEILKNLTHRGGVGSESETGDGAGILFQIPHAFMKRVCQNQDITLPEEGGYGVAMLFASPDSARCKKTVGMFSDIVKSEGLEVLGVREVPTYDGNIGKTAREVQPDILQIFIRKPAGMSAGDFERELYVISKISEREIRYTMQDKQNTDKYFYIASISSKTIVYKGMLLPSQLTGFYLDLQDEDLVSAIALVHSRYSTNTFPSWERAHPIRHIIHNGEINTIRGNINWMKARESMLKSEKFGASLKKVFPVINEDGSDSAMLDNFLQMLYHSGYGFHHALMMAIPEPWENNPDMDGKKKAFYEYASCLLEPWDGPAAIAFTDGEVAGATLDRNGLRPSRYYVTKDGFVILASEVGVLSTPEDNILKKERLRPGRMLLIDTKRGKIIEDAEIKESIASERPYAEWLAKNMLHLDDLPELKAGGKTWKNLVESKKREGVDRPSEQVLFKDYIGLKNLFANRDVDFSGKVPLLEKEKIFGYTWEDLRLTLKEISAQADDPIGAMGVDTPLAVLSNRSQLLYNYFKQLFAQVTNPPIDAIREKVVTSSTIQIGGEGNLLEPDETNCRVISHSTPVLSNAELQKLRGINKEGFKSVTLPIMFSAREENGLEKALNDLFFAADMALDSGYNIIILSDRGVNESKIPIPALLAVSGLHHYLIRKGRRTKVSIVAETGEPREVHHFSLLVGYGANAVNPYLAYEAIEDLCGRNVIELDPEKAKANYTKAITKNIVKVMSKMGISTVRSYHGAQIFEALGVSEEVINKYFTGTTTRIGGVGLKEIETESRQRHKAAYDALTREESLEVGGNYKWRKNGEYHLFNPENIYYLQQACRRGDYEMFKAFSSCVNKRSAEVKYIRGMLSIVIKDKPLPLSEIEPAEEIVRRFKTGAMSYGSISREAHETMAVAMNRLRAKSNTGEGGEIPERFSPDANGDDRCSAIKQVASGRFGVTINYLTHSNEIQIKMAQGAKPGEGGHLPGRKVYPWIAKSRYSTPGVGLISPPPHHDIYSIEDLAQLIHDLKNANRNARISVKLASEVGVGTIAVGVAKGLADVILISGYDGGTGAAPRTSIRHTGLPWELGIAETHQTLLLNNLRNRVRLETDGKLLTGRDVVIAALLGAEEFGFATGPLMVMGCDMMRVCNLDTCPVGVATQNPALRAKFCGKPEYIENFMMFIAEEVREWMARIGVRKFSDLIGRVEMLKVKKNIPSEKAKTVDLSQLLFQPKTADSIQDRFFHYMQDHHLERSVDKSALVPLCLSAIENKTKVNYRLPIRNINRTVGTLLSNEITKIYGEEGLPDDTIHLRFDGSAGQSFGAFLARGVTLELHGDSNDYIGKGLSGGRIIVSVPEGAGYKPDENIIIGNVAFYGATSGEAYIQGIAGERFCVRNSGVNAVVEGVGDHGCEYMTGGIAVILGRTGRNFGAGMSGGVAYVYDDDGSFPGKCNTELISLECPDEQDAEKLKSMLEKHVEYTGSEKARAILADYESELAKFVKIIPNDYKKILLYRQEAAEAGKKPDEQDLYAFDRLTSAKAK